MPIHISRQAQKAKSVEKTSSKPGKAIPLSQLLPKQLAILMQLRSWKKNHKSLYAHCFEFAQSLELSASDNLIAASIIEDLQPTGWLDNKPADLAKIGNFSEEAVEQCS
jgi:DNA-directed RNA polymerase specialized sigma54-like protein